MSNEFKGNEGQIGAPQSVAEPAPLPDEAFTPPADLPDSFREAEPTTGSVLANAKLPTDSDGDAALPAEELEAARDEHGGIDPGTAPGTTTPDETPTTPEGDEDEAKAAHEAVAAATGAPDLASEGNDGDGDATTGTDDGDDVGEPATREPIVPSGEPDTAEESSGEASSDEEEVEDDPEDPLDEPVKGEDESDEDYAARRRSWSAKKAARTRAEKKAAEANSEA